MWKRYFLYLVRWQLSTPLLAPIISIVKSGSVSFGSTGDWIGAAVANMVGGLIFFWVDKFIFTSKKIDSIWQIKEKSTCVDCGKVCRGYRLVKSKNYDKTKAKIEFRCETCSIKKAQNLRDNGVDL
jgi:hypothetical protein